MAELYYSSSKTQWPSMECLLSSFEEARPTHDYLDIRQFVPEKDHPDYSQIVSELIRIDLEYAWKHGDSRQPGWYESLIPGIFQDSFIKNNVFFEIQRLQTIYNSLNDSCRNETAQLSTIYHPNKRTIFKPLNPGEVIGEFEIVKSLGKGAFGQVYLATPVMDKNIKLVLKFTAGSHNEIEILRSLNHPHIMPVLEQQPPGDLHAIIMPFLGELTLMDFIYDKVQGKNKKNVNHKDINFDNSMGITRLKYQWISKLASAVGHIHEKGYIHRDLKPANVLISFQNEPILIDFNMAIKVESQHVTHHGGTLAYMAPEQLCERCGLLPESTFSTDIYSLGLIITELLTGALPFPARSGELRKIIPLMRMDRQKSKLPAQIPITAGHSFPTRLLERCLAPDPFQRYPSTADLLTDLEYFLKFHPEFYDGAGKTNASQTTS